MLMLGIDTASSRSSVALCDGSDVLVATSSALARRHGEFVAPAVAFCLNAAGVTPQHLDVIAVDVGPGLYTGMRVGIGFGQTLALATGAKTVPVTSTDALAFAVRHLNGDVLVALDGRRSEVFLASYRVNGGSVTSLARPCVMAAPAAALLLDGTHVAIVGDGFSPAVLDAAEVPLSARHALMPDATAVALVAHRELTVGDTADSGVLAPVYLRHADAKIGWETRGKLGHHGVT